jgi:peptidoglycan-associated lipoprotein
MKNISCALALVCLTWGGLFAQPINRPTAAKMAKAAEEAATSNNPYAALEYYQKVFDETKEQQAAIKIAEMNYILRDYANAEKQFGRFVNRASKTLTPAEVNDLRYYYAMCLKLNGKYADAVSAFRTYLDEAGKDLPPAKMAMIKNEIAGCEMAPKLKPTPNLNVANGGKKLNAPQTESSPSFSNGKLYFTSIRKKTVVTLDGKEGDWYSKVYTAEKAGAEFGEPKALGTEINRESWHQGNVSITPDGKTMYFTRVETENNGMKSSKIFFSPLNSDGWGAANEVTGVNGDYVAKHPCEGELFGEKVLFFVANIPGGQGGDDIYYAPKRGEGQFGAPINLGAVVNTVGNEVTPFYRDGKLFYSSNGRPSIGGLDVFESQWNGTTWSEPRNLGPNVNSSVDDLHYVQNTDGLSGFFVSNRPGINNLKSKTCCDDIYAWEIERVKVNLLARTFRLKKGNEKENPGLTGCSVQIYDLGDRSKDLKKVGDATNASANDFAFDLLPDRTYMLIANRDEYTSDTLRFNTVGIKKSTTVEKKITLRMKRKTPTPPPVDSIVVRTNEPIRLNSIYYDFNDDKILPAAEKDLQFLLDLMNKYTDMKIELSSHTDARGDDKYNEGLSQRRAQNAKNWLTQRGIVTDRITPAGYGERQLLNSCGNGVKCTEEEHQLNRRTEFKILSGPTSITIEKKEKRPATIQGTKPPANGTKPQNPGGNQSKPLFFYLLSNNNEEKSGLLSLRGLVNLNPDTTKPVKPAPKPVKTWANPADREIKFEQESFHFDTVQALTIVSRRYTFKNTGTRNLEIEVVSACDCMAIDWTRGRIRPGKQAVIDVSFNSKGWKNNINKDIDVIFKNNDAKGYPLIKQLKLTGFVVPEKKS